MGLLQEGLRRSGEIRNALAPVNLNPSEIKASRLPARSDRSESRIPELLSLILGEKDKVQHTEAPKLKRGDGFEPFVNPKPSEDTLFVNGYNGNFTQQMELNRKRVEKVLRISHLEGQVFLTSLSFSRQRSMDGVNPDGSVAAKKKPMLGEEIDDSQKEINPPYRTVPTRDGWRIEINDGKIMEDLNEKGLTGEKQQKTFIKKFSQLLNKSLFECIRKEKMTGIKDKYLIRKVWMAVINPGITLSLWASGVFPLDSSLTTCFVLTVSSNLVGLLGKRQAERLLDANFSAYIGRKLDAPWEYFMPMVEVDKVARTYFYLLPLLGKGKTLVREAKQETK